MRSGGPSGQNDSYPPSSFEHVRRLYESFAEGFATGDLMEAKGILDHSVAR